MACNLSKRHLLKLEDLSAEEIRALLALASRLKAAKSAGKEEQYLRGKNIVLLFEQDSTRTRTSFEVAAFDQGAHVTYIGPSGSHVGQKESIRDTARVLGRLYDGIAYRGQAQETVEELGRYAGVPVWNAMTAHSHPTQVLADLLTIQEHVAKPLEAVSFCFVGNVSYNMADTLLVGGALMGMDVRLAGPRQLWPGETRLQEVQALAANSGARLTVTEDVAEAVRGCDVIYTDVWVSMGEDPALWGERIRLLTPYQVTPQLMALTRNPQVLFMHCLPALHNTETGLGRSIAARYGLEALEVTDEVFESPASIVFEQSENRMHTIKALMVATLAALSLDS
ncbi:ornithine carbamoyltransferase [Thermogemmatispora carboxidivorans]|uniref:ornithine carbamoyltransferase n=1 Tax=Thermogemmatispora carboxidivorans TaxID=1382306 RepID=UPI00069C3223|nr:ornithine carbamoyltransferase [Thermogemmatispora carboxidivorans]